jgi:hypothetical protein
MLLPAGLVYHQKAVLVANISRYVSRSVSRSTGEGAAESLLDIGAGSLETALPLAGMVRRYHAVERDPEVAERLEKAGLKVTRGAFPLSVPMAGGYDLVLASHSVPEDSVASYLPFLSAAWDLTGEGGTVLVVTFKGSGGDLAAVRQELLGEAPRKSAELEAIIGFYEGSGGAVAIEQVNSFVEGVRAEDIVAYITPWISGKSGVRESIRSRFLRIVETRYRVRPDLFIFPTQHLFLSCRKTGAERGAGKG